MLKQRMFSEPKLWFEQSPLHCRKRIATFRKANVVRVKENVAVSQINICIYLQMLKLRTLMLPVSSPAPCSSPHKCAKLQRNPKQSICFALFSDLLNTLLHRRTLSVYILLWKFDFVETLRTHFHSGGMVVAAAKSAERFLVLTKNNLESFPLCNRLNDALFLLVKQ